MPQSLEHISDQLNEFKSDHRELRDKIELVLIELSALKVKASIWGVLGGSVPVFISILIFLARKLMSGGEH